MTSRDSLARVHLTVAGASIVGVAVLGWVVARVLGSRALYLLVYAALIVLGISYAVARKRLAPTPSAAMRILRPAELGKTLTNPTETGQRQA